MAIPKNMLFSLDGNDMFENFGKLESSMRFYMGGAKTMAYWSDTEGGGRFTLKVSQYFIYQLKEWILGTGNSKLHLPDTPYSSRYEKFKQKLGLAMRPWLLFENVYKNVDVIWRGKHGRTVGIRRSIKVPRVGVDGKSYGSISVARYAAINEFGGRFHKPRPLFTIAMLKFTSQHFPRMAKMMKRAIINATMKQKKFLVGAVSSEATGTASNVISEASLKGAEAVAKANVDSIFRFQANELFGENAKKPVTKVDSIAKSRYGTYGLHGKMLNQSKKEVEDWLKQQGMTMEDLHKGEF